MNMNKHLSRLSPKPQRSARQQITDSLRSMLADGRLKPGDKLPSTKELGALWRVPEPTVHRAMVPLTKEGLLVRTPRLGTFVRGRQKQLAQVGIYVPEEWQDGKAPASSFQHCLRKELLRHFEQDGIQGDLWVDSRSKTERDHPWDEFSRMASGRRFQVVIAPQVNLEQIAWLEKLSVPVVYLSTAPLQNRVWLDLRRLADMGIQGLADQGCRRVGVISSLSLHRQEKNPDGSIHEYAKFYRQLAQSAAARGLELRPEWIMRPDANLDSADAESQQFGYERMSALWQQKDRPEGILVFDDVVATGVLMAAMQLRIDVPSDLKLALSRNAEIGLFCPVPAAFVDVHVRDIAAALLLQAKNLYDGQEMSPVTVPYHLVPVDVQPVGA
jgi:DNA-binding LacI/PurR family transcriptional regulator